MLKERPQVWKKYIGSLKLIDVGQPTQSKDIHPAKQFDVHKKKWTVQERHNAVEHQNGKKKTFTTSFTQQTNKQKYHRLPAFE